MSLASRYADDESRWAAFLGKDPQAHDAFVVAVRTTGIFCRSTCPARPHRENVRFFDRREVAIRAGFRACRRCNP